MASRNIRTWFVLVFVILVQYLLPRHRPAPSRHQRTPARDMDMPLAGHETRGCKKTELIKRLPTLTFGVTIYSSVQTVLMDCSKTNARVIVMSRR